MQFFKLNLVAWRQVETSSYLLFNSYRLDVIIWNFSVNHRLHILLPYRYGLARSMISNDNIGVMVFSFRLGVCLESSVEFAFCWFLKVLICWHHLSLNEFSVRPM